MVRVIQVEQNLEWLPVPNTVHLVLSDSLPMLNLITSAFALAFVDDRLLMTDVVGRGWDIPGGHIEEGEQPEDAARREVSEETGAKLGPMQPIAYQHIRLLAPPPAEYCYPYPDSYQVFYVARIMSLGSFDATGECRRRDLFSPQSARTLPWVQRCLELYETASFLSVSLPMSS
jgi:8-oxo-dGTP diphosphatase